jgi:6-phospho-beta-glucosidase
MSSFPKNFLWGAASSSYQFEGAYREDGKGLTIMDVMRPKPQYTNKNEGSDHYHRYREDIALLGELGLKAYRFSISWARIFPSGDDRQINEKGAAFYSALLDELEKHRIEPIVTILHCDLPLALEERYGGWMNRRVIDDYARYAETLFKLFGKRIRYWLTYNEQNMTYMYGMYSGINSHRDRYEFNHILNLAQAKAMKMCHEMTDAKISTVPNIVAVYPLNSDPLNVLAAANYDMWRNGMVLEPLYRGTYPVPVINYLKKNSLMFEIRDGDMELLASAKPDFIGFNYYGAATVKYMPEDEPYSYDPFEGAVAEVEVPGIAKEIKNPLGRYTPYNMGYDPVGLRITLRELWDRYRLPLMITENGYGEVDKLDGNDTINDDYRIEYLREHIVEIGRAIEDGVDVQAYCPWSAIDLISVSQGISKRYGFIYVNRDEFDLKDFRRIKKKSFGWYQNVIQSNGGKL